MKRSYKIFDNIVCEIPSPNRKRSQKKFYWSINELKSSAPYFSINYSNHSFQRTRKWILENYPELLI